MTRDQPDDEIHRRDPALVHPCIGAALSAMQRPAPDVRPSPAPPRCAKVSPGSAAAFCVGAESVREGRRDLREDACGGARRQAGVGEIRTTPLNGRG